MLNFLESKEKRIEVSREIAAVINRHSLENGSDTPDFMLSAYLVECLITFSKIIKWREKWYGREKKASQHIPTGIPFTPTQIAKIVNERPIRKNGGVECDVEKGPCACGAWHGTLLKTPPTLEELAPNAIIYRQPNEPRSKRRNNPNRRTGRNT